MKFPRPRAVGENEILFYVCSALAWTWMIFWIMVVAIGLSSTKDMEQALAVFVVGSLTFQWSSVLLLWFLPTIAFALLGLLAKPTRRR